MRDVKVINGNSPELYIDGKRTLPVLYGLSDFPAAGSNTAQAHRNIANFASRGIHLVTVDSALHIGWHKAVEFNCDAILAEIAGAADADPETGVILRLHLNPPYWWLRDNPDETVIYRTPNGDKIGIDDGEPERLIHHDFAGHMRVSLASRKWLDEAGSKLRDFCKLLKVSHEANSIIGIQVACGIYGEWHQWGTDVSRPMKERFANYLHEKYITAGALRKAWNDDEVTFETSYFRPETFRPGDYGTFRDPQKSMDTIDSQKCNQTVVSEAILHFCSIVKEELPEILAGCFYGYYVGSFGNNATISGHLDVDKIHKARGVIDFLCGPFPYMINRLEPDSVPLQRGILESCRLNGILWLTEMDQHPWGHDNIPGGDPDRFDETVMTLRRNVLQPLLSGHGLWYYDHRVVPGVAISGSTNADAASLYRKRGWWESPELMNEIEKLYDISADYFLKPYKPAADVLIVVDTDSFYIRSIVNDREYALYEAVARTGVAYDVIYLKDISKIDCKRYRCLIFYNVFLLNENQRIEIDNITAGMQVIWMSAAGICSDTSDTIADENVEKTVGMKLERISPETGYTTTADYGAQHISIASAVYNPLYSICDDDAEAIAFYDSCGKTAAARKNNVWYFPFPLFNYKILTPIFNIAGVHRYVTTPEPILAGSGIVALNTYEGGKRTIYLRNGKIVDIDAAPHSTVVIDAETGVILLS